jgi:very-short-patch-repair endonuclease
VAKAVEDWCKQLIDLTGRNQLLYYRTLKRGTLELTSASDVALDSLLSGRSVRLSQLLPATAEEPEREAEAVKRAQTVHGKALTHFEERGIETLYLAWGMATWTTATSQATPAAPVLLRPLKFKPRGAAEADFDVCLHGDWDVNATLLHLLATDFKVDISAEVLLETLGDQGPPAPDPSRLFDRLSKEADEVPHFEVLSRVVAGTFAYTKLPMVKDLQENVDALASHDLIAAIAGDSDARESIKEMHARDTDATQPDFTPPDDEFLVLDADASQNLAINAAVAGEPLIVQGPPGTGKSQTIANLITSLTARGERVLFVAEKRAAIDAVTKRLRKVGLGDLVMDLHGGVTSKKQLAAELSRTLEDISRIPRLNLDQLHHDLEGNRKALREHAAAMHEVREPWGLTLFQVNERLIGLGDDAKTNLRFAGSRLNDLDSEAARTARDHLKEWAKLSAPVATGASPFTGAEVRDDESARRVVDVLDGLATETVPRTRKQLDEALEVTGLPEPPSVESWQRTLALLSSLAMTLTLVKPEIVEFDLDVMVDDLEQGGRSTWYRMIAQIFSGRYRRAKKDVRSVWLGDAKPNGEACFEVARGAAEQRGEWAQLGGQNEPRVPDGLEAILAGYAELTDQLAVLGAYVVSTDLRERPRVEIDRDVAALIDDQATLFRLPRIYELGDWLGSHHLAPLLEGVRHRELDPEELLDVFEHAWLSSIRTHVSSRDPRLANFDGELQNQRSRDFQQADREHLDITAARVQRAVAESAIAARDAHGDQDDVVAAQARRKRGHMTLRRLFEEAPDVLTSLRPCWTMSPLVVSQTLPARQLFDVVIFDEASQVLPADAIPALLRAPRAVVAGDRRQLPPTTFFDGAVNDDDEDDDDDGLSLTSGFESVLDVLDALLRGYMLTWHYRSEDERLIAFSNHNIYDSGLTTFPGAASDGCLRHVLVPHRPGVPVDTRSTDDEVARVVDLMVDHALERPDESLGVIAMGQHHAGRIEAALRERISESRDRRLDEFFDESREERAFVKNLERVQGDERDAIILSVGYAKQPNGNLAYRFGPLNMKGGERRLNVAVTRARRRLTLVSSFSHTDMEPGRSSAEGVELLRRYLKFAESGGLELEGADDGTPLNPFEIDVKYRLEEAGLHVIPQYGSSGFRIDFAVAHPTQSGRMVLAVEADGASYHSSPTARDRDRLRQQMLERLGWRFHRIWSTDWFNDPEAEVEKVLEAYEVALALKDQDRSPDLPVEHDGETEWEFEQPERQGRRPRVRPGAPISEYSHKDLVAMIRWVKSDTLLRTEDQLLDAVMEELGFKRRGKRIVDAIMKAIKDA